MMKRFGLTVAAIGMLAIASPARAQVTGADVPPSELGLGLQVLRVGGDPSNTFPLGFNADFALYRWGQFGLAFEGGWARDATDVPGTSVSWNYIHFGGGPRLQLFPSSDARRVRPYMQLIGGLSHARFSSAFDTPELNDVEESDSAFMLQPGGGVNIDYGGMWGLTGSVDYRRAFFDAGPGLGLSNTNEIRAFFGVRMFIR